MRSRARNSSRFAAAALVAAVGVLLLHPMGAAAQSHGKRRPTGRARAPRPIAVTSIELALDEAGEPGEVVERFRPVDNPMHFVIRFDPARAGTHFEVKLWAVRLLDRDEHDVVVGEVNYVSKPFENMLKVEFELPEDWPAGTWKITVHANDVFLTEHEFEVVDSRLDLREPADEIATARRSLSSE